MLEITQEMMQAAQQQENEELNNSPEFLRAQNAHLQNRVVVLRAAYNELEKKLKETQAQLSDEGDGEAVFVGEGVEQAS